jgi:hypothetical protein
MVSLYKFILNGLKYCYHRNFVQITTFMMNIGGSSNPIIRKLSAEMNVRIFIPSSQSGSQIATFEGSFDNVIR